MKQQRAIRLAIEAIELQIRQLDLAVPAGVMERYEYYKKRRELREAIETIKELGMVQGKLF